MKKNTKIKSLIALAICAAAILVLVFSLSSCKKEPFRFELSEDEKSYTLIGYNGKDTAVEIPAEHEGKPVTAIGREAFLDNGKIKSVIIPDSITSIGFKAFAGCTALTSVSFGHEVNEIGISAFEGCTALTEIEIPEHVTSIEAAVFMDCSALKKVTLPESVSSVTSYAFIGCDNLETISVATENHHFAMRDGYLINLEDGTLVVGLASANLTENCGVTSIAPAAFYGRAIERLTLPESVKSIGESAFYGCAKLASINILGAKSIGDHAFYGCKSMNRMLIGADMEEIGEDAFADCQKLTMVFYDGNENAFKQITVGDGNRYLELADIYFYSGEKPEVEGKFWHYSDGNIAIWF